MLFSSVLIQNVTNRETSQFWHVLLDDPLLKVVVSYEVSLQLQILQRRQLQSLQVR